MDCPRDQYNVDLIGAPGGGGEYDVQLGFGWTNGVALRFLNDFGDQLKAPSVTPETFRRRKSLPELQARHSDTKKYSCRVIFYSTLSF